MKKLCLIAGCIALLTSCLKYELPSEPKLSGTWRIDKITYHRIEDKDTIETLIYNTGEFFIAPNDSTPLDTVQVGFTTFAMDYGSIYFNPHPAYGGGVDYQNIYFHTISGSLVSSQLISSLLGCFSYEAHNKQATQVFAEYKTSLP